MSYPLSRLSHLYREPGRWAFVQLDVGLDAHGPGQAVRLRWQSARKTLLEQDIPPNHLKTLDELFDEAVEHSAPACRFVLAGPPGIGIDDTVESATSCANRATVAEIPLLAPMVSRHVYDLPYLVVEAGRDGRSGLGSRSGSAPAGRADWPSRAWERWSTHCGKLKSSF